ncbi:Hypothetical_protein [Hexamita inflata]|uniref:Hypothetical_protein n=1 Tax=Hexamita inflata TaxID=28002 RepID=A0AA86TZC0_9EUKA|nr:Hypothetical protein HINF_LOCUS21826 [Hexamita inflata]
MRMQIILTEFNLEEYALSQGSPERVCSVPSTSFNWTETDRSSKMCVWSGAKQNVIKLNIKLYLFNLKLQIDQLIRMHTILTEFNLEEYALFKIIENEFVQFRVRHLI